MDEFDLIDTYLKPLARGFPGSLNLSDDAAIVSVPPGCELVVTKDASSAGVHFIGDEDPALIAKKLLRVNLSDLAAMGATPLCYFLALMIPGKAQESWLKRFSEGLAEDQNAFHIHLAGGDTIATQGALSFSITALGTVAAGKALKRSGAKAGDTVYVSGTLGDSALGLRLLIPPPVGGRLGLSAEALAKGEGGRNREGFLNNVPLPASPLQGEGDFLINRYLLPQPRLVLGQKLIGIAHACMDISDGLVQDLGHICRASGVGAVIHRDILPLSEPARKLIAADTNLWECALSGGDDYELLFTAPAAKEAEIQALAEDLNLPLTAIGHITHDGDVRVLDNAGKVLKIKYKGFSHF